METSVTVKKKRTNQKFSTYSDFGLFETDNDVLMLSNMLSHSNVTHQNKMSTKQHLLSDYMYFLLLSVKILMDYYIKTNKTLFSSKNGMEEIKLKLKLT